MTQHSPGRGRQAHMGMEIIMPTGKVSSQIVQVPFPCGVLGQASEDCKRHPLQKPASAVWLCAQLLLVAGVP